MRRLLLAAVAACALSGPAWALRTVSVTDGDTLTMPGSGLLTGFAIRLLDIDAPELRGRCPEEVALANKAKARLSTLVAGGVTFQTDLRTDEYGRILARAIDAQGRDVGRVLVAEGLARLYDGKGARQPWCPAS